MTTDSDERNNLTEAINALSLTTASLEKRIARLDDDLHRIKAERKAGIHALVAQLLPDLRRSTFDNLLVAVPGFADAEVRYLMLRQWYFLFFFKRKGYDQTLTTLRTRMAFAAGKGLVPQIAQRMEDWNKNIDTLHAERGELALRQRNVLASLALLRAAAGKLIRLPDQVKRDVQTIVQKARAAKQAARAANGTTTAPRSHTVHGNRDTQIVYGNVDTWSDFAADVPQSLVIMAFDTMRQSQQANPKDDSAGIDFAEPPTAAMDNDIDFGDATANSGGNAMATDDRLGAFS
ncbi:MAG TPA: hypothetical protein VF798_05765 [Burkholderiaceae bacterium]